MGLSNRFLLWSLVLVFGVAMLGSSLLDILLIGNLTWWGIR